MSRFYHASVYTSNYFEHGTAWNTANENERYQRKAVKNILESYHYINNPKLVEHIRRDGRQVFLDSGAFSAFTKGVNVDLPQYCRYIQENEDIIFRDDGVLVASVLDGIGDPQKTLENQQAMERLGVQPLPCFHYGEDTRYLEHYIANYEYITLGGMVPISNVQLVYWLDEMWDKYLTDGAGRPRVKVHGFGMTSVPLLRRYPWYSVDSSSWTQAANNGRVYLTDGRVVAISAKSPARKIDKQHYDSFPEEEKAAVRAQFAANGALDVERLRESYVSRWSYNLWVLGNVGEEALRKKQSFRAIQPTLF